MTPEFQQAIGLIRMVHAEQVDKAGRPYLEHLERVAKSTATKLRAAPDLFSVREVSTICTAALLHDTVEDTGITLPTIRNLYSVDVAAIVGLVTKKPGELYPAAIQRIATSGNLGAVLVKLSDLEDNMDPDRRELLAPDQRPVPAKYREAHERLTRAAEELGYRAPAAPPVMASTLVEASGP